MRILSFYPTKTFKLILEFENNEYRILDVHKVEELMKELCEDIHLFMSAELDGKAGTIRWGNLAFDPNVLYDASRNLDNIVNNNKRKPVPRKITRFPDGYKSKISLENEKLLKLLRDY